MRRLITANRAGMMQYAIAGAVLLCLLGEFASAVERQTPTPSRDDASLNRSSMGKERASEAQPRAAKIVLREGTIVGPLNGRFVVSGQRWRFLVHSKPDATVSKELLGGGIARSIRADQNTLLGRQSSQSLSGGDKGEANNNGSHRGNHPGSSPNLAGSLISVVLVTENLMLDRIARAIDQDPNDDHWSITGRITEFREENRLTLTTAVRSTRSAISQEQGH